MTSTTEPSHPLVYLDLDRTLFKTANSDEIWRTIETLYPQVNAAEQIDRQTAFHVTMESGYYYYDFTAQLQAAGCDASEVYRRVTASPLADGRMQFDGEAELITWLDDHATVMILSFGMLDYQAFKQSLCPALRTLSLVTVLEPKSIWLADKDACWLVDDKPLDDLPAAVHFVQVSLEGKPVAEQSWPVLTSLNEVKDYLTHNIDKA